MDKKEIIMESAIKVIAANGFHNTSVRMIADTAGIAVGTIYNHFSNKDEILNYIFKKEFTKRIKLLMKLKEEKIDFTEKLSLFLNSHFDDLNENPNKAIVLVQESRVPQNHSLESINDFMEKLPLVLGEMLNEAMLRGEIRVVDEGLIANAIFHVIREVAFKVVSDPQTDCSQAKEELINFIWLGLQK